MRRLIVLLFILFLVNTALARPSGVPEPIWCLSDAQTTELIERYKPIIRQGGEVMFSMLVLRKVGYLTDERTLYKEKSRYAACQKRTQIDANAKPCDDVGLKRLEQIMSELDKLESESQAEPNRTKMQSVSERINAIRAEYPACQ